MANKWYQINTLSRFGSLQTDQKDVLHTKSAHLSQQRNLKIDLKVWLAELDYEIPTQHQHRSISNTMDLQSVSHYAITLIKADVF